MFLLKHPFSLTFTVYDRNLLSFLKRHVSEVYAPVDNAVKTIDVLSCLSEE